MTTLSKLLWVDTNGDYVESKEGDSLKFTQFQIGNYALDEAYLGKLVDGVATSGSEALAEEFGDTPANDASWVFTGPETYSVAHKHTPSSNETISKVSFKIGRKAVTTSSGNIVAEIRSDSSGLPGSVLYTSAPVSIDDLAVAGTDATLAEYEDFIFTNANLVSGTDYYIAIVQAPGYVDAGDGNDFVFITNEVNASSTYYEVNGTDPWSSATGFEFSLRIYAMAAAPGVAIFTDADGKLDESFLQYNIDFGDNVLSGVAEPQANGDAANKLYVDNAVAGITGGLIDATTGVADAGKAIKTDANGLLDESFLQYDVNFGAHLLRADQGLQIGDTRVLDEEYLGKLLDGVAASAAGEEQIFDSGLTVDQSGSFSFGAGSGVGMGYTPASATTIDRLTMSIQWFVGNAAGTDATGNLKAEVRKVSDNSVVATSALVPVSTLSAAAAGVTTTIAQDFTFAGESLDAGVEYALLVVGHSDYSEVSVNNKPLPMHNNFGDGPGIYELSGGTLSANEFFGLDEAAFSGSGAGAAGVAIFTDASGKIDQSFLQYNVNFGGNVLSGVSAPSADTDAANKLYVDAVVENLQEGIYPKGSVKAASTANIDLATGGLLVIDGYQTIAGDRILVKDQTDATENGIYVAAAGAWSRSTDMDGSPENEIVKGSHVYVEGGDTQFNERYVVSGDPSIAGDPGAFDIGLDPINWFKYGKTSELQPQGALYTEALAGVQELKLRTSAVFELEGSDTLDIADLGIQTAHLAATSVTAAKLGADVAGDGLAGGNGVALSVVGTDVASVLDVIDTADTAGTITVNAAYTDISTAQSYIPASNLTLQKIVIPLEDSSNGSAGNMAGHVHMAIFADDGSGLPTGAELATSDSFDVSFFNTQTQVDAEFTFATPFEMTSGTKYHITLVGESDIVGSDSVSGPAWIRIKADPKTGVDISQFDGSSWAQASADTAMVMHLYTGEVLAGVSVFTDADGLLDESFLQKDLDFGGHKLTGVVVDEAEATSAITLGYLQSDSSQVISLQDAGDYFAALGASPHLEDVLQSVGADLADHESRIASLETSKEGLTYMSGEAFAKGDLLGLSTDGKVYKLDIATDTIAIGVAGAAASAADESILVLANDEKCDGVLSSATPSTRQFWSGSAWASTMPTTGYVWMGGVAASATDLHVQVRFIKVNSAA